MKKILHVAAILLSISIALFAQKSAEEYLNEKGEVYFSFNLDNTNLNLSELTRIISIDNVKKDGTVFAYANRKEYQKLREFGVSVNVLKHPGDTPNVKMANSIEEVQEWNAYPTYEEYVAMMQQYANDYPDICEYIDAGPTVDGRNILFLKISDNVSVREEEPQFMYTSTMHGDETTGYVLMLHLIDSLLTSYGTDARITDLVDNVEIWINPLANPDGTYAGGNSTINGSHRSNANWVDLNRNFPDPDDGPHPDGEVWQPETIAMMNVASSNFFVMSANFHGGAEVVNYPWDTWSRLHADDSWWQFVSHEYADTCHAYANGWYMTGFDNGITNGYDWYPIYGGRQDYMTYFKHGREVTIELSDVKTVSGSELPTYWEYNKRSFLNYIEQCRYGLQGKVTFELAIGIPQATITIVGHDSDADSSQVLTDTRNGSYFRLIKGGTYDVQVSAPGYVTQIFYGIQINDYQATVLNVDLLKTVPVELVSFTGSIFESGVKLNWTTATETNNKGFEIQRTMNNEQLTMDNWESIGFIEGYGTTTEAKSYSYADENLEKGKYIYRLKQIDFDGTYHYSPEAEVDFNSILKFELSQNYPNPFNPSTKISFSIPEKEFVTLLVFNVNGEKVKTLINENLDAGKHSVDFNAAELASGIYFYKISTGKFSDIKKMVLLR
ncbi:MAG: T9SS type A sorting domain-containing protein [Chlorobi bacterium]|nr:T9SS type A sorting domain-containing protein [Chlorobiota bacterium]